MSIHLSAQVEPFSTAIAEIKPHLQAHWEELALDKDAVPLDPDWDRYRRMDEAGMICMVTLRAAGKLVGYCCLFVQREIHYRTTLTAVTDVFYIAPEYRGTGGGLRLFRAVEDECRRRGVVRIYAGSKLHRDSSRLFLAMGYSAIETWFSKRVTEA